MKKPSLFTLLLLIPFATVSSVLFTPALPELATLFHVSDDTVQSTMTLFLFGYAFGGLPYGPIAKRWGRKWAIYCGVAVALVGTGCILFAGARNAFGLFLGGRFLSALGGAVSMQITMTIIGDICTKEEATKKLAILTMALALAPGLAIGLGGFLTVHYGWQSCFYALIAYGVVLICFVLPMPETAPRLDKKALHLKPIITAYKKQLTNKKLGFSAVIMGLATAMTVLFSARAPFLGISKLGLTPEQFGIWSLLPPLGLVVGSLFSHKYAARYERLRLVQFGGWVMLGSAFIMLLLFLFGKFTPMTLFLPIPMVYFGNSIIFNNVVSFAMDQVKDKSNGSAILNFINMFLAALIILISQAIVSPSPLILPLAFLLLGFLVLLLQKVLLYTKTY